MLLNQKLVGFFFASKFYDLEFFSVCWCYFFIWYSFFFLHVEYVRFKVLLRGVGLTLNVYTRKVVTVRSRIV